MMDDVGDNWTVLTYLVIVGIILLARRIGIG